MPKFYRVRRPEIEGLRSARLVYRLNDDQCFYETPKAYEIWGAKPLPRFVKRIPKQRILFVHLHDGWGFCPACDDHVRTVGTNTDGINKPYVVDTCIRCGEQATGQNYAL